MQKKTSIILTIAIGFLASCTPSQEAIQIAIEETQAAIPTETPAPTIDPNIAIDEYKGEIGVLTREYYEVVLSISERSNDSLINGTNPDKKDKLRELYNRSEEIVKQMAELTPPPGYENAQTEFQLAYQYAQEITEYGKAMLIGTSSELVDGYSEASDNYIEHYHLALSYLED